MAAISKPNMRLLAKIMASARPAQTDPECDQQIWRNIVHDLSQQVVYAGESDEFLARCRAEVAPARRVFA